MRSTLFVVGEYLGWVEVLRRDLRFLDPAVAAHGRALIARLAAVEDRFVTDGHPGEASYRMRLFRGEQRAIGELMIDPAPPADTEAGAGTRRCVGYATFDRLLDEDERFAGWFARFQEDVSRLAAHLDSALPRIVAVQHALLDLVDELDDPPGRVPVDSRRSIRVADRVEQTVVPARRGGAPRA